MPNELKDLSTTDLVKLLTDQQLVALVMALTNGYGRPPDVKYFAKRIRETA